MSAEVSLAAAFVAGIFSISSPCVLPLVPIYLAHLAGEGVGATGSVVSGNRFWLIRLGGALLVLFGLHRLGIIRLPFLDRERRIDASGLPTGQMGSSFVVGVTFGAGWSPCVGPILGAILTMAAGQGSIGRAAQLLSAYSLGLAVPFLAAALAYGSSPGLIRSLDRRLAVISGVSGGVMVAVGAIMILGLYQQFFARMVALSPWTPLEPSL